MPNPRFVPMLAFIAALTAPLAAGAQTTPPPAPAASAAPTGSHYVHRHHRPAFWHALRGLNLTSAQQQQIAGFRDAANKANLNADPATRRANGEKLHDQVMAILTPDQKTQLQAQLHRRHTMGESMQPAPVPSPNAH